MAVLCFRENNVARFVQRGQAHFSAVRRVPRTTQAGPKKEPVPGLCETGDRSLSLTRFPGASFLRWHVAALRPLLLACALLAAAAAHAAEPFRYPERKYGGGELRYINGLPVLVVAGSPEEMGQQAAVLSADGARELIAYPADFLRMLRRDGQLPRLFQWGQALVPQFPPDHLRELESFARAAGVQRDVMIGANTLVDCYRGGFGCSSLIVEPQRSATAGPLFGRNLDFPSLGRLHLYSLVTVCRPTGKHAFASVGFPGMLGCLSGMNDAGLALATHEVFFSKDRAPLFNPKGTPYMFCFRRILEECTTVEEAEKLLRSLPRTTLFNLAVCDRRRGAVLECTPQTVVLRPAVDGICACANHFRSAELGTFALTRRYAVLEQSRQIPVLTLADVTRKLHEVNQGFLTLQTMVFEPAALRLHLAIGSTPSSALPVRALELGPLFAAAGR